MKFERLFLIIFALGFTILGLLYWLASNHIASLLSVILGALLMIAEKLEHLVELNEKKKEKKK